MINEFQHQLLSNYIVPVSVQLCVPWVLRFAETFCPLKTKLLATVLHCPVQAGALPIIETCNVFKSSKQLALFRPAAGNNWHCSYLHQRICRASVLTSWVRISLRPPYWKLIYPFPPCSPCSLAQPTSDFYIENDSRYLLKHSENVKLNHISPIKEGISPKTAGWSHCYMG